FTDNFDIKSLPDYIIPDKFKRTHTNNLINYFIDDLCSYLECSINVRNGKIEFPKFIELSKFLVGIPFSSEYAEYTHDDAIPRDWKYIPNKIILPELDYIKSSIENLVVFDVEFYKIDYYEIQEILCSLFLIRF